MEPDAEIERLQQALEERDDFLAIVTHELRNPLHTLSLQLAAACKQAESANVPAVVERLKSVQATLQHYSEQAMVLLELARVNSQGVRLRVQRVDVATLLSRLAEEEQARALHYQIELLTSLPASCIAEIDPAAVEHMVENLLINAFKHSGGRSVNLSLRETGGHAVIAVADDGKGIPADDQGRIFGKFEHGGAAGRRNGSGLGLWIVRLLSEALGARISLQDNLNGGSVFIIEIPLKSAGTATS